MARFYNQLRSLKGTAIGTIIAWAGDIGSVPPGWIICNGTSLNTNEYPELFSIIGYQYGGSGTTFLTPRLLDKAIADYHPSHSNIPGIGLNTDFIARMGENTANLTSGATSNIDLYLSLTPFSTISARVTDLGINPSGYSDDVGVIPRVLGDHHMASHTHLGLVPSVQPTSEYAEQCQSETLANCSATEVISIGQCQDNCSDFEYWPSEANGNVPWSSFVTPTEPTGDSNLGVNIRGGTPFSKTSGSLNTSGWPASILYGQFELQNTPNKNYMIPEDDTEQRGANTSNNPSNSNNDPNADNHPYPVHLNHPGVNFGGSPAAPAANSGNAVQGGGSQGNVSFAFGGHDHPSLSYSITIGNVRVPNIISTTNISTGNVTPINSSLRDIGSFRMENINTPSLNIIHIIRAY